MGTQYVDDHRFLLCKGSTVTDITRAVSQPEARDELDALSVELTFTAVRNNNRDKYMHWYGIEPGDKLRVVNHGREVFSGVILTVGLDGTVTANDMGWYLTKSEIILQLADAAAPDAVQRMCAKAGIAAGTIDLPPTRISQVWVGSTPEQILEDILAICSAETGLTYRRRVREGALQVGPLPTVPIIPFKARARYPPAIPAKQLWRDRGAAGHRRHPPLWAPPSDEPDGGGPPIPPGRRRRGRHYRLRRTAWAHGTMSWPASCGAWGVERAGRRSWRGRWYPSVP